MPFAKVWGEEGDIVAVELVKFRLPKSVTVTPEPLSKYKCAVTPVLLAWEEVNLKLVKVAGSVPLFVKLNRSIDTPAVAVPTTTEEFVYCVPEDASATAGPAGPDDTNSIAAACC